MGLTSSVESEPVSDILTVNPQRRSIPLGTTIGISRLSHSPPISNDILLQNSWTRTILPVWSPSAENHDDSTQLATALQGASQELSTASKEIAAKQWEVNRLLDQVESDAINLNQKIMKKSQCVQEAAEILEEMYDRLEALRVRVHALMKE